MSRERSRQRKLQRKAQKRREQLRRISAHSALPEGAARDFDEAETLISRGRPNQAIPILEDLARRYPRRVEVLVCLADAQRRIKDNWSCQLTCEKAVTVAPNSPELWLAWGSAAVTNTQLATAHRAFAHVVDTWPDHPDANEARGMRDSLLDFLDQQCRRRGIDEGSKLHVMRLHDAINLHLNCRHFERVCATAAQLLAICPTFAPALNNRSQALFHLGRIDEAIADCRRVLQFDPTNYHALGNLTRFLYLSGQFEEAQAAAADLNKCDAREGDAVIKKIESFAILGDWEALQRAYSDGQEVWATEGEVSPMADHLMGVALANLGDPTTAREHWRRASTDIPWAQENLEDSKRPPAQRHGPWAFSLDHWIPLGIISKLREALESSHRQGDLSRLVKRHFDQYPQMELLADAMLQRGDPRTCELLVELAGLLKRPAMFGALRKFALSERGRDELRMKALMTLSRAGFIDGQVEIWREGSLNPVALLCQEITGEPTTNLPPAINDLMVSAYEAIREGRGVEAERLLDEVLRLQPDHVPAKFNRALARTLQGREEEALAIVREIHRDHPDYLFARTQLATDCISRGDLEQAKTLLAPIALKKRLHRSEFVAWCGANVQLALANGNREAARGLLNAWEQLDPDDPRIPRLKRRIDGEVGTLGQVSRFSSKPITPTAE